MMLAKIAISLAALLLAPVAPAQEIPSGQVILDNAASIDADLYLDDSYACHAPAHASCIAEVSSGLHIALIVFADGDFIPGQPIDVPADMAITLPVRDLMT